MVVSRSTHPGSAELHSISEDVGCSAHHTNEGQSHCHPAVGLAAKLPITYMFSERNFLGICFPDLRPVGCFALVLIILCDTSSELVAVI